MKNEMHSLEKNHTWDLVPQSTIKNVVKCRWVFQTKFTSDSAIENHNSPLVTKWFSQQEVNGYTETFAPISKMNYVRLILSLATHFGWEVHQMDIKSSFSIATYLKIFIWIIPLVLWHIPFLFVNWRSHCMVWNKPPWLGMRRLNGSLLIWVSNIVNFIIEFIYCILRWYIDCWWLCLNWNQTWSNIYTEELTWWHLWNDRNWYLAFISWSSSLTNLKWYLYLSI